MQNKKTALELLIEQKYQILITVEETARILGISPQTVRNQVANGKFPIKTRKYGCVRRIDIRDLASFLDGEGEIPKKRGRGRPRKTEQVNG